MDDDRLLFDWIRHYAGPVLLVAAAAMVATGVTVQVAARTAEAWSIVVQVGDRIPPRQLGPLAQAVFRSEAVYGPAMTSVGLRMDPEVFLEEHTELRPVPGTDGLIVIGRSDDEDEALAISEAMAEAFVAVMADRSVTDFSLFERASPVHTKLRTSVALVMGGVGGFWIALGAALAHYRLRRPLLSLRRALRIAPSERVTLVRGRGPSWLGALRRPRRWRIAGANREALERLSARLDEPPRVVVAEPREERARMVADAVAGVLGERWDAPVTVLIADAGSREPIVRRVAAEDGRALELVWVS